MASGQWSCVFVCLAVTAACSGHRDTPPVVAASRAGVGAKPPVQLPGCTAAVARALDQRLTALEAGVAQTSAPLTIDAARAELQAIWKNPCLALLARFSPVPEPIARTDLQWLSEHGFFYALREASGAEPSESGERSFVTPPELPPALAPDVRRALDPWVCSADENACGARAASYIARAEESFSQKELSESVSDEEMAAWSDSCKNRKPLDGEADMTPIELWASCVARRAPNTHRYASLRYRAPERGWLVLRGRRGHYTYADEIHAYDLASGSAYIARSAGALFIVVDGTADHAAADARRRLEVVSGVAVADQVRELAFALVTLGAVGPARSYSSTAVIPPSLALTLSGSGFRQPGHVSWSSSDQTDIAFTLIEGGAERAQGTFTWPNSANAAENHADTLWRVLEAGIERSCPPAALPKGIASGRAGGVSSLDADPAHRESVFAELAQALETHSSPNCGNAR